MSDLDELESGVKGKQGELKIIGRLLDYGFNVYTPMVDMGLDCLVEVGEGEFKEIQIKTRLEKPLFQIKYVRPRENFYIVCYLLSKPEIWVIPSKVFLAKASLIKGRNDRQFYRLSIGKEGSPSYEELRQYRDNFAQLIGNQPTRAKGNRTRISGSHFTQPDLEIEILQVINEKTHPMSSIEIIRELKVRLGSLFTQADLELTVGGRLRWEATARFAIYQGLKKKQYIEAMTKNQWVITEKGKQYLSSIIS